MFPCKYLGRADALCGVTSGSEDEGVDTVKHGEVFIHVKVTACTEEVWGMSGWSHMIICSKSVTFYVTISLYMSANMAIRRR